MGIEVAGGILPTLFRAEREANPGAFTINQEELDGKIKAETKARAERDAANTKLRESRETAKTGISPAEKQRRELKKQHWALLEDVKNSSVRLHSYGEPDVNHWQTLADQAKASLDRAGISPGDESRFNLALKTAEGELLEAQKRLKRYRSEHTRAVGLLKSFESEHKFAV
jgi:chromosome segregation ATPase